MLKNISNLGKTLNRAEKRSISGGKIYCVIGSSHCICPPNYTCQSTNGTSGYCVALIDSIFT